MTVDIAFKKLIVLSRECGVPLKTQPSSSTATNHSELSTFERLRKEIHTTIKAIRTLINEKNKLDCTSLAARKRSAETAASIRSKMERENELLGQLEMLAENDTRTFNVTPVKSKGYSALAKRVTMQNDCLDLCRGHFEECQKLLADQESQKNEPKRGNLFRFAVPIDATQTELPEIEQDFAAINHSNALIDGELENLSKGVYGLKEIAIDIGKEVEGQQEMLQNLQGKAGNTERQMENLNVKLKATLQKMMAGDKFMVNLVLFFVLLGLLYFLWGFIERG